MTIDPHRVADALFDHSDPSRRSCTLQLHRTIAVRKLPAEVRRWAATLDTGAETFRELVDRPGMLEAYRSGTLDEDVHSAMGTLASHTAHRTAMLRAVASGEGLFYATAEFTTLLAGAWPTIPLDSMAGTPPVGCGVVYLQQPMPLETNLDDRPYLVRSVAWNVLEPTDTDRHPLLVCWAQAYDQRWQIGRSEMARVQAKPGTDGAELSDYRVIGTTSVGQIGMAAMLLLQQDNLVATEPTEPSPAQRKARGRKAKDHPHEPVKVVRLRRATRQGMEQAHAAERSERHTRWIVRGHWREQACGKGRRDRRRIYIAPHYKGPEDGTLIVRDTVFQW